MGITLTSITPSIAYKGQSFRVYLNQSEAASQLPLVLINGNATLFTSNTEIRGYVSSIDLFGNSFLVTPLMCYTIGSNIPKLVPGYIPSGQQVEVDNS